MTLLGMDVDRVTAAAGRLDAQSQAIAAALAGVDQVVAETEGEWFGPDERAFVESWFGQHRAALVAAQGSVAALVVALRRNVAEQQQASAASAAPSPRPAAQPVPSPGGRTPDGLLDVRARSVTSGAAPRDVQGLLALLPAAYAQPGGVAVTFTGTGADRHAIVAVSGTEDWSFGGTNPDDMSTNLGNAVGAHTLKQEAIQQAMLDAGVQPTDKVLLVGHSQGGADVIDFAADPANASRFHIAGVVTAGAPETVVYPKSDIPVLELRTDGDVVPALGASSAAGFAAAGLPGAVIGAAVHDATVPGNVKIVELPGGWELPWNAHAVTNYVHDAAHVTDPAVSSFVDAHRDFLTGAPATTYTYSAERVGGGVHRYE